MTDLPSGWKPQPTSRMCFVCGRQNPAGLHLTFYDDLEAGQVKVPLNIPDTYQGYPGIVHGGIVATVLDEVSGRAIALAQEDAPFWMTAKMEVRYHKPTPTETPLTAVGWVEKLRNRSARVVGEIRRSDGTVTASVASVVVKPSEETLREWEQEQEFWRVEEERRKAEEEAQS